jgi:prolipoprotein diacylglyceryl transferase
LRFEPYFEFVGYAGLASYGGAIDILTALLLYARRYKVDLLWLLDRISLAVPLAGSVVRVGNLMNSEIIGSPSTMRWAFVSQQVDDVPRHPGQLYEAIAYLGIFLLLYLLYGRGKKREGFVFGLFLALVFLARFAIEFSKANQSAFENSKPLNMGQLLSLPSILLGLGLMLIKGRNLG